MLDNIKIVRVFIGSPGGLEEERRAAREIVNEINQAHSEHWGCQFKLLGWEDTIPGYQRPQSLINLDLDKCQYFIGVLWNRWGTKPDLTEGGFTSGFEEEFYRARDLLNAGSMKDIALYFKNVNVPEGLEPGPDIKKVQEFRDKCIEEKCIYFRDFVESHEFRDLVRSKIIEIGWREYEGRVLPEPSSSQADQSPEEGAVDSGPTDAKIFDPKALEFLSAMSSRTRESEPTSAYEVARFRLIAASLGRPGNDELYLGNHDANLIFRYRREMSFSDQEIRALVDCGVVGFDHQNVPLWRWLGAAGIKSDPFARVKVLAVFGSTDEKKNAIKLLQILEEGVPDLDAYFTKEKVVGSWLNPEVSEQIFGTAVQFLMYSGLPTEIETLQGLTIRLPLDRKAKVNAVIAAIKARLSHQDALKFICECDVDKLSEDFVDKIFSAPLSLPTEILSQCVTAKSSSVRLRAVKLLIERGELAEAAAHDLLSDSDHLVRLMAVESLQDSDNPLSDETVKTVLTIKKATSIFGFRQSPETDATIYDRYRIGRLQKLDFSQLRDAVVKAGVFNEKEVLAFYRKFGNRVSAEIRDNLRDRFARMFEENVQRAEAIPGLGDGYRKQVYELQEFYQERLCSGALAVLCGLKVKADLRLVRETLDAIDVRCSTEILTYLAKFGDWHDIARIERLKSTTSDTHVILALTHDAFVDEKAAAIFEIGKNRMADLLEIELSSPIKKALVSIFPKGVFAKLGKDVIIKELDNKDDDYRIIFALRCVESLSRDKIEEILEQYIERDTQRYYNSIHWLDLGVSLPKKKANAIVRRELARRAL